MGVALKAVLILARFLATSPAHTSPPIEILEGNVGYILGSTGGRPDRPKSAFHPDLNLYYVRDDQIRIWSGTDYRRSTKPGEPTGETGRISLHFESTQSFCQSPGTLMTARGLP